MMINTRKDRRGFTMTELMVVIGIIVLLIAILLPVVKRVRISAANANCQSLLNSLVAAVGRYELEFHAYPGPVPNDELGPITSPTPPTAPGPMSVRDSTGQPIRNMTG